MWSCCTKTPALRPSALSKLANPLLLFPVLLVALLIAVPACNQAEPDAAPTVAPTPSPLPPGFTILQPFTPSYPCELQNVTAQDEAICRNERVEERIIGEGAEGLLIERDYHIGQGCWSGVNQYIRELKACDRNTGEVTVLTEHLGPPPLSSPDGAWYAYYTFEWVSQPEGGTIPQIQFYRIRPDGTELQVLDAQGLPGRYVGAQIQGWSPDGAWLELTLWDGTQDGWHPYRLKSDGSGVFEPLEEASPTEEYP